MELTARYLLLVGRQAFNPVWVEGIRVGRAKARLPAAGGRKMDESTFQKKLAELVHEIGNIPEEDRVRLQTLAAETRQRHEKLKQTVSSLQDSIDYLRLSIKYLLFDLEATRRENGYLRKMLEEQSGNG